MGVPAPRSLITPTISCHGVAAERLCFEGPDEDLKKTENTQPALLTVSIAGTQYPRVRYGEEADDWGADRGPCHDCAVLKGQQHVPSCDVERCPACGGQRIGCDCDYDEGDVGPT